MKKCCDGNCNQGRDCPERKEADFTKINEFVSSNYGYATAAIYVLIAVLLIVL